MKRRTARSADIDTVAECVALAFAEDPIWSVALRRSDGRTDHLVPYWRLFVAHAVRLGSVSLADDGAAVSVWVPPGEAELDAAGQAALEHLIERSMDEDRHQALRVLYERFEASRLGTPGPHQYLSLLATHPRHRGRGIGQGLLAEDLAMRDTTGIPSYLESTNPANDHRYERFGFRAIGGFDAVLDTSRVTAMWRAAPRSASA